MNHSILFVYIIVMIPDNEIVSFLLLRDICPFKPNINNPFLSTLIKFSKILGLKLDFMSINVLRQTWKRLKCNLGENNSNLSRNTSQWLKTNNVNHSKEVNQTKKRLSQEQLVELQVQWLCSLLWFMKIVNVSGWAEEIWSNILLNK